MTARPRLPANLGPAGRSLWRQLVDSYVFDPHELPVVEQAARQADDTASLQATLAADGLMVTGSKGQPRLNPAVGELRLSRQALARLLGSLHLPTTPDEDGQVGRTARQRQATNAASRRWAKVRRIDEGKHG